MDDTGFPVEMIMGIPVVGTPEEIDITNAPGLGKALADAAACRERDTGGRHEPDPVL